MKLTLIAAAVCLYLILWLFSKPVGIILKIMARGAVGCAAIYIMNTALASTGFFIGINPVTCAVCGILGISGLAALAGIQLII